MKMKKKRLRLQVRIKAWEATQARLRENQKAAYRCPGSYRR